MSDGTSLGDLNLDDDSDVDSATCAHDGGTSRKFGGSIVCDLCNLVIGNWRTDPPLAVPATRNADGSFAFDAGMGGPTP